MELARPSVRPSVRQSVPYGLVTGKEKWAEKPKTVNVPRTGVTDVPTFSSKGQL